jgi:triacylglycerol lipase|tara:strand:- start:1233 stop:1994 length:762 start_codon:yes stop_codon:yes gene_type:complete
MIRDLSQKEKQVLFAKLSAIAYDDVKDARSQAKLLGFTKTVLIDIEGAQTYVFTSKTDCAIACRGTEPSEMNDIYADLEIFKADSVSGNKIHQGFKEEVDKVYPDVEKLLDRVAKNKDIWACGHSLGGAMATILAQRLEFKDGHNVDTLYTYGSPRAGGPQFSKWCDKFLNHQRFVNNNDVVPCVPTVFRWRHNGQCNYIKSTGEITTLGRWSSERIRDKGWSLLTTILRGRLDIIADHNIDDYIMHLENNLD